MWNGIRECARGGPEVAELREEKWRQALPLLHKRETKDSERHRCQGQVGSLESQNRERVLSLPLISSMSLAGDIHTQGFICLDLRRGEITEGFLSEFPKQLINLPLPVPGSASVLDLQCNDLLNQLSSFRAR